AAEQHDGERLPQARTPAIPRAQHRGEQGDEHHAAGNRQGDFGTTRVPLQRLDEYETARDRESECPPLLAQRRTLVHAASIGEGRWRPNVTRVMGARRSGYRVGCATTGRACSPSGTGPTRACP